MTHDSGIRGGGNLRLASPRERLAVLDGRPGVAPEVLALEERLMDWRETVRASLRDYPLDPPADDLLDAAIRDGRSLADICSPLPTKEALISAATGLTQAAGEALPGAHLMLTRMTYLCETGDPGDLLGVLFTHGWHGHQDVLRQWAGAKETSDAEALDWLGRQLARPFFHLLGTRLAGRQAFANRDLKTLGCPCCGGPPRLSRYERDEGQRYLWCDLCDVQWRFARVNCPFCGNTTHEQLGYLTFEELPSYRVDVCEVCHTYLRAKNERDLPEGVRVDFAIEDVGTLHLSLAAEQAGYRATPGSREA